jgi:hypothetical protein
VKHCHPCALCQIFTSQQPENVTSQKQRAWTLRYQERSRARRWLQVAKAPLWPLSNCSRICQFDGKNWNETSSENIKGLELAKRICMHQHWCSVLGQQCDLQRVSNLHFFLYCDNDLTPLLQKKECGFLHPRPCNNPGEHS